MDVDELSALPAPLAVARLGRNLGAVPRGRARELYFLRHMADASPPWVVRVLACAQRESALGVEEARVLFDVFGSVFEKGDLEEALLQEWFEAAELLGEYGIATLLDARDGSGRGQDPDLDRPPRGSLAEQGETLGRRKTLARTATGDLLDRLAIDPHPDVIENLLLNPRMNEARVVGLAARPKTTGAVLRVIARSRYASRHHVRRAIALNVNCPASLSTRLLASLTRADLLEIAHHEQLSHEIRSAARALLESKPAR